MKIIGSSEKINPLYSLYITAGLLCVAIPFRVYQLLSLIESDTGFYKEINWSVYLMYAVCILAVLVPYVLTLLAKNVPESRAVYRKNKLLAAASFIFGVGIAADAITAFSTLILVKQGYLTQATSIVPALFQGIFGILAAIYIIVFGISYIDGRTTYSKYKLLALCPLVWAAVRLVMRFVKKISYVNVSDLMLELFAIAFMMLFLLSFARISSGLSNKKSMRSLWAAGFASAFLCAAANLPRLVVVITGNGGVLPEEFPFALCDFGFAFFAACYIVNSMKAAKINDAFEILDEADEDIPPVIYEITDDSEEG